MKNALALVSAAAFVAAMAAPLTAQSVPLNTVSGGQGEEVVAGQGIGLSAGALGTAGAVVGLAVLTLVAVSESTATTEEGE